jgi:hypothetical protein
MRVCFQFFNEHFSNIKKNDSHEKMLVMRGLSPLGFLRKLNKLKYHKQFNTSNVI